MTVRGVVRANILISQREYSHEPMRIYELANSYIRIGQRLYGQEPTPVQA